MATAYANRSASNFYLGHFKACLEDIDISLLCGYSKDSEHKLYERQGKCYVKLGCYQKALLSYEKASQSLEYCSDSAKKEKLKDLFEKELETCQNNTQVEITETNIKGNIFHGEIPVFKSEDRNNIFLSCTIAVCMRESSEMGRGLVATRDIDVGEILIVEKPYSSVLLSNMEKIYCHHCCSRVVCPLPCCRCRHVVYCSMGCQRESWDSYHKFECKILSAVQKADIKLGHLALRMIIKTGLQYLKSRKEDLVAVENVDAVGYDDTGKYRSDDYFAVYNLVKHSDLRTQEDMLQRAMRAAFLLKCLEKTEFFKDGENMASDADRIYVAGQILRHLQMLPCNAHEISELKWKPGVATESETLEVGSGIYATLSLINHSCDPSVVRHCYGNVCVVRSIKRIPKGEEILDNYGALYPVTVREERRAKLSPQYYFDCNCDACQLDLPTYFNIPCDDPVYKCDKCAGPVFTSTSGRNGLSLPCSSCICKLDMGPKVSELQCLEKDYRGALEEVLGGSFTEKSLGRLLAFLSWCCGNVCLPWREFNNCQEAVKQCYAVQANCYNVDE